MNREPINSEQHPIKQRLPIFTAVIIMMTTALCARYGLSGWWAKYLGVGLWAGFVYFLAALARPSMRILYLSGLALFICWSVEFFQLTPVPAFLSSKHIILRLIFGTTFSAWDLPTYAAGIFLGSGVHSFIRRSIGE